MRLGAHADGRSLTFDEDTQTFAIGDVETSAVQIDEFDAAGQVAWTSLEARAWFHQRTSPPPASTSASVQAPETPRAPAEPMAPAPRRAWLRGDPAQWAKTREKGFPRFLLTTGLTWAVLMFVATGLLNGTLTTQPFESQVIRAAIWLVGGQLFAATLWWWGERAYRRWLESQG